MRERDRTGQEVKRGVARPVGRALPGRAQNPGGFKTLAVLEGLPWAACPRNGREEEGEREAGCMGYGFVGAERVKGWIGAS